MSENKKLYIVTGAAGFLGSNIVRELHARGCRVRGVVLPGENITPLEGITEEIRYADVCDVRSLAGALDVSGEPETAIIHTAGIVSIDDTKKRLMERVNIGGTANVVGLCKNKPNVRLVYVSSVHAIPPERGVTVRTEPECFDPQRVHGAYAKTKAAATALVLEAVKKGELDASVVMPSGIIGPWDSGVSHMTGMFLMFLRRRLPASITGGYDFADVRDVAAGTVAAADRGRRGECYILSNRFVTLTELFGQLSRDSGITIPAKPVPMLLVKCVVPFLELHYLVHRRKPLFTAYSLRTLTENSLYSHRKASEELGYEPRELEITVADTVEWLRSTGRVTDVRPSKQPRIRRRGTAQ